jgi:PAS domain S-box-containing protein
MNSPSSAESSSAEYDQRLRLLLDAIQDIAIYMLDATGRVSTWSAGAQRLKGYGAEEIIGKNFACFYSAEDVVAGKPQRGLDIARREGRFEEEAWRVRRDGSRFLADVVIMPLHNAYQEVVGFGKVVREVTEQHRIREKLRLAIEAAPAGMLMIDMTGCIVMVNAQIERLFGYSRDQLLGQSVEMLVPERFREAHPAFRRSFFATPVARPMGAGRDLYGLHKDGREIPIEIGLNPLRAPEGDFVLSSVVDITERKQTEAALRALNVELEGRIAAGAAQLREREVMLQEIHHRVKNNLQIMSSLINMQVRTLADDTSRTALRECQSRIRTMALIHEKLYESNDYASIHLSEYIKSLSEDVIAASGSSMIDIRLELELEDISTSVDRAIPCGMILNELITNALKHAFTPSARGTIRVGLQRVGRHELALTVSDDGIGMSGDFSSHKYTSLGAQLVTTLVAQLGGTVTVKAHPGSTFRIVFPLAVAP